MAEWAEIPTATLQNLAQSFLKTVMTVTATKGDQLFKKKKKFFFSRRACMPSQSMTCIPLTSIAISGILVTNFEVDMCTGSLLNDKHKVSKYLIPLTVIG